MSNEKVTLHLDRDVVEFLDKTGEDALGILLMLGLTVHDGGTRESNERIVAGLENWKKVRKAIEATGVKRDGN
jgi:hypothetical protein